MATDTTKIDPEIEYFLAEMRRGGAAYPPLDSLTFPEQRQVAESVRARWSVGGPEMARTQEYWIATGSGEIRIRVYVPHTATAEPAPALIYLHGGGWTLFSLDTHDRLMREYAHAGGFAVIGADYPLSPEHRYPIALDRITALSLWLAENGASLGIDPLRMAIGGDSAGGNLAITTALRLRACGRSNILQAILSNYGYFTPDVSDAAEEAFGGDGSIMDRAEARQYYANYLPDWPNGSDDPLACPIYADLTGLPPVFLAVPECDLLAEQSFAMHGKFLTCGVDAKLQTYRGATHSFLEAMSVAKIARTAITDGANFLRDLL